MKSFDREQLVYVTEVILTSALDLVVDLLPHDPDCFHPRRTSHTNQEIQIVSESVIYSAGKSLSILFSRSTDDGLSEMDALYCAGSFDLALRKLINFAWTDDGQPIRDKIMGCKSCTAKDLYGELYPDCRKHAEQFVNDLFGEDVESKQVKDK